MEELINKVPKEQWAEMMGRVEGFRGALGLAQEDGKQFNAILKEMGGEFAATDNAFKKQTETFSHMWTMFSNSLGKITETIGMTIMPAAKRLLEMWNTEI